ncbi:MAG: S-layer homology domain-containing protein [Thermoanaerobaculia bacterium]
MRRGFPFGMATALALLSIPVRAQETAGPFDFGTQDEAVTVIGWANFFPAVNTGYDTDVLLGIRFETQLSLFAPADVLPNGAVLEQIVFYFNDSSNAAAGDFSAKLCRTWVDSGTGANPGRDCPVSVSSNGSPGDSYLEALPHLTILYRQDIDGDGVSEIVSHFLQVGTPPHDGSTSIRMVRLRWRRQVNPAPAQASFNDVPTNDPAFQFIEALVASGITAGCGAGNYCPDAPLTRRQMAVFLAKALGPHWPWNAQ